MQKRNLERAIQKVRPLDSHDLANQSAEMVNAIDPQWFIEAVEPRLEAATKDTTERS